VIHSTRASRIWFPLCARGIALVLTALLTGCATLSEKDRRVLQQQNVPAPLYARMLRHQPLALGEIVELSRKNVPPNTIVRYIDTTLAEYQLKTEDVVQLRRAGVSAEVIDYLLTTPGLNANRVPSYDPFWMDRTYRPIVIHHYHRRR
jgi:hypothetical protein